MEDEEPQQEDQEWVAGELAEYDGSAGRAERSLGVAWRQKELRFYRVALWEEQRLCVLTSWGRRHREQRSGIRFGNKKTHNFVV